MHTDVRLVLRGWNHLATRSNVGEIQMKLFIKDASGENFDLQPRPIGEPSWQS